MVRVGNDEKRALAMKNHLQQLFDAALNAVQTKPTD